MSKLKKARLDEMIENALSYKQESRRFNTNFLNESLKGLFFAVFLSIFSFREVWGYP